MSPSRPSTAVINDDPCASCGYGRRWHERDAPYRCPVETADRNGQRGKFRVPPPVDRSDYRQIMRRDFLARQAAYEAERAPYVPVVIPPPQVPARAPQGPGELAGYGGRQAVGLGRKAAAAGWLVAAFYARRHDGGELCAVKMQKGDLYAVATWTRKAGNIGKLSGWSADIAYGMKRGTMPIKMTHTQLEGIFQ